MPYHLLPGHAGADHTCERSVLFNIGLIPLSVPLSAPVSRDFWSFGGGHMLSWKFWQLTEKKNRRMVLPFRAGKLGGCAIFRDVPFTF
jgi:hypothetical protein